MASEIRLEPGTILEGRYGILREVSAGETNRVYEGRQTNLGLRVTIKTLVELYEDPTQARQQVEQVALEARILAALSHPNLLAVHDCFMHEGMPLMVSEWVDGRRLAEIVELAPKTISAKRVLSWTGQLLDVLGYLHGQDPPIIVRDLKPSNIILGRDGRLRLVDFSLAKRMSGVGAGTQEIVKGLGADGFAPLEQLAFSRTSPATDLYALGATVYFLLTRLAPPNPSARAIAGKDPLEDPRLHNDSVTEEIWSAIQKLMAVRAQDRPQSAAEARDLLFREPARASEAARVRVCVDCGVGLDALMRQGVEIDQCHKCGGIWLDRFELERLIELSSSDLVATATLNEADKPTQELEPEMSRTVRLDDIELPPTSKVWQFLRDVLGQIGPRG